VWIGVDPVRVPGSGAFLRPIPRFHGAVSQAMAGKRRGGKERWRWELVGSEKNLEVLDSHGVLNGLAPVLVWTAYCWFSVTWCWLVVLPGDGWVIWWLWLGDEEAGAERCVAGWGRRQQRPKPRPLNRSVTPGNVTVALTKTLECRCLCFAFTTANCYRSLGWPGRALGPLCVCLSRQ